MNNTFSQKLGIVRPTSSGFYLRASQIIYDDEVKFLSCIGYPSHIKNFIYDLRVNTPYVVCSDIGYNMHFGLNKNEDNYEILERAIPNSEFVHMVFKKKSKTTATDRDEDSSTERVFINAYKMANEPFSKYYEQVYEALKDLSYIPVMEEWVPEILNYFNENYYRSINESEENVGRESLNSYSSSDIPVGERVSCLSFNFVEYALKDCIQELLSDKVISIDGSNDASTELYSEMGLDEYLNKFKVPLAEKIEKSFSPKFRPGVDEYDEFVNNVDDFVSAKSGIELYEAQKCTIQAIVNNMKVNSVTNVIGECGSGKSLIAATSVYAHNASKGKGFNAVVMCPSHLVNKWKREIEGTVPNSRAYVISSTSDLIALKDKIKDKNKTECTYIVLSKESAKLGYTLRPAAVWSKVKKAYVCPHCGKVITKKVKSSSSGSRRNEYINVPLDDLDFLKESPINFKCPHCSEKLWTAVNKDEMDRKWVKLSGAGWVSKTRIFEINNEIIENEKENGKSKGKRKRNLKRRVREWITDYHNGIINDQYKGTRKMPISSYIKKFMSNDFDYCILDEAHELKGKTAQGYAAYDLIKSSKKTLLLTGTLLNGFAHSLFYLLYRTNSSLMKSEGFSYDDENKFAREYGVIAKEGIRTHGYRARGRLSKATETKLPGVSPVVFTKFLLNNSVFLSLSDMEEGLPEYNEYPLGVTMDDETREAYEDMEDTLSDFMGYNKDIQSKRVVLPLIQATMVYPDAPHNATRVVDPDDGEVGYTPKVLSKKRRNKEEALIDLVKEKLSNGEKVLVYYNSVNKTDIGSHLIDLFKEEDIHAAELKSTDKADKREEWINDKLNKGMEVLICNPRLVETGLDLLDFTTVVFYQVGYNLFTLRQSSRRSWRLSQTKPISVYFMYYRNTLQEQSLSLMASKLYASMAIEGKFSEEGLRALSDNKDVLSKVAENLVEGIKDTVDESMFNSTTRAVKEIGNRERNHTKTCEDLEYKLSDDGYRMAFNEFKFSEKSNNLVEFNSAMVRRPWEFMSAV